MTVDIISSCRENAAVGREGLDSCRRSPLHQRASHVQISRYLISRNFRQGQRARTRELKVVDLPRAILFDRRDSRTRPRDMCVHEWDRSMATANSPRLRRPGRYHLTCRPTGAIRVSHSPRWCRPISRWYTRGRVYDSSTDPDRHELQRSCAACKWWRALQWPRRSSDAHSPEEDMEELKTGSGFCER